MIFAEILLFIFVFVYMFVPNVAVVVGAAVVVAKNDMTSSVWASASGNSKAMAKQNHKRQGDYH